jgi:hypothetical protein
VVLLCAVPRLQGQIVEMPARDLMRYEQFVSGHRV